MKISFKYIFIFFFFTLLLSIIITWNYSKYSKKEQILGWVEKPKIESQNNNYFIEKKFQEKKENSIDKLTIEKLSNLEYYVNAFNKKVKLINGFYKEVISPFDPGLSGNYAYVMLLKEYVRFGDLNQDKKRRCYCNFNK